MMRSYLSDVPEQYLQLDDITALWSSVKEIAKSRLPSPALAPLVDSLPAPEPGRIATTLRQLNIATGAFDPFKGTSVVGRDPVRPTINNTIEFGWQGVLFGRLGLNVDVYQSRYNDFVGPLETLTPTVFFDSASLSRYLIDVFVEKGATMEEASTLAAIFVPDIAGRAGDPNNTGLPVGNVSPNEAADPSAILLTYRNYGDITLYGTDIGMQVGLGEGLTVSGHMSYVDRNFFRNLDSVADLSLNAPKFKFGVGVQYRNTPLGLSVESNVRHVDGFPIRSGVYNGFVPTYTTVSLNGRYELPWVSGLAVHLDVQNLLTFVDAGDDNPFDARHVEFVGTPAIGRLGLVRMSYEF
jgi:iron complex outermembrane receptor protein